MTTVASSNSVLLVSEVFGPTFQGEGPSQGRRCAFLRLGGCNLACTFCDTAYTWDWTGRNGQKFDPEQELQRRDVAELWEDIKRRSTDMLVVTGGEPLLQQERGLTTLLQYANAAGMWVEIETAGTITPSAELVAVVNQFNVSLKLSNSGNVQQKRYLPDVVNALQDTGRAVWKFVVQAQADLDEVASLVRTHGLKPVWIMPEGTTQEIVMERARAICEEVVLRGWNLTTRLHIRALGDRRGV